jgi:hypothetical protein
MGEVPNVPQPPRSNLPAAGGDRWRGLRDYSPLIGFVVVTAGLYSLLIPLNLLTENWRPAAFAFLCGGLVGIAEIATRYRDEPIHAIRSPYGLLYTALNGAISVLSLLLIFHYSDMFRAVSGDKLLAAIAAGFGSSAVMRTRLAVLKGPDGKEVSIGPDLVINQLLQIFDQRIDRLRAKKRQAIVISNLPLVRKLGSFSTAANYLLASLLAFQNMSETNKSDFGAMIAEYEKMPLPDDIKYLALGFVFLTLVGETQFGDVVENAARLQLTSSS